MPTAATTTASLRNGRMIEAETETAEIPIKKTAQVVLAMGSTSNFSVSQLQRLFGVPQGDRCATNQVSYSLADRAIEHDLLPWCEQHSMPVMAYSPLGGPGARFYVTLPLPG